jgi:hypothetical protein
MFSSDAALGGTVGDATEKTSRKVAAFGESGDMLTNGAGCEDGHVGEDICRGK